jgi:hypothetical protein
MDEIEDVQTEIINEKYNRTGRKKYFEFFEEHALFEVFRTEKQPLSYKDLKQFKIAEFRNSEKTTHAAFEDSILLEKDYYYVVRAINTHGLLSNPSPIYKVQQTKDADETFLSVEIVGFVERELYQRNLKFQKLLQLVPGTLHTIYDTTTEQGLDQSSLSGKLDQLTLGRASVPVWGRKFKLRITSTDTGKKIDLNVDVKLTKKNTADNL